MLHRFPGYLGTSYKKKNGSGGLILGKCFSVNALVGAFS